MKFSKTMGNFRYVIFQTVHKFDQVVHCSLPSTKVWECQLEFPLLRSFLHFFLISQLDPNWCLCSLSYFVFLRFRQYSIISADRNPSWEQLELQGQVSIHFHSHGYEKCLAQWFSRARNSAPQQQLYSRALFMWYVSPMITTTHATWKRRIWSLFQNTTQRSHWDDQHWCFPWTGISSLSVSSMCLCWVGRPSTRWWQLLMCYQINVVLFLAQWGQGNCQGLSVARKPTIWPQVSGVSGYFFQESWWQHDHRCGWFIQPFAKIGGFVSRLTVLYEIQCARLRSVLYSKYLCNRNF